MTIERRLVVGLDDIKAVTFECLKCKARTTIPSGAVREIPRVCNSCNELWRTQDIATLVTTSGPAAQAFIESVRTMQIMIREKKDQFRILLEFDEPKSIQ